MPTFTYRKRSAILCTFFFFFIELSYSQVIHTYAGNGSPGNSGDNGPATNAMISSPQRVCSDTNGNLFITSANKIRKVDAAGMITTIAGNGTSPNRGDGGPAINAFLNLPEGLAADLLGNVYISEENGHTIRKISSATAVITTIVGAGFSGFTGDGGLAVNARLNSPQGICVDKFGNLYIADMMNHRIRKVDATTGIISTIAGNGISNVSTGDGSLAINAAVPYPMSVCVDNKNNLYIAEHFNGVTSKVRKLDVSSGVISTIAGNGVTGYNGDGGPAVNASLNIPRGITADALGNIYIAEYVGSRVRKVNANTGIISTIAGNGTTGFSGDGGLATNAALYYAFDVCFDKKGTLYIADRNNQRIRYIDLNPTCTPSISISGSSNTTCYGTPVTFDTATTTDGGTNPILEWKVNGVKTGTTGNTFTSATLNNHDIITCELTSDATCATTTNVVSNFIKMTVTPSPVVSISGDTCGGSILTVNSNIAPASLFWTLHDTTRLSNQTAGINPNAITIAGGNGAGTNPNQLNKPTCFFVDASGNMYIPDMNNNRIQKWAPGATSGITVAGGNGAGSALNQLDRPTSVAMDSKGNLYVTDQNNNRVLKFVPGNASGVRFGNYFSTPTNVFIDANDNIYISQQNNSLVTKFPAGSSTGITVAGGQGWGSALNQLSSATGIVADLSGNIYVCDTDNDRVQKWAPGATSGITVAGGNGHGSGANQLANPLGVFADSYGNIYVADYNNARVQKWAAGATSGTTVAGDNGVGTGANQLDHPEAIWINANGDLIVSDLGNHRVQKFSNSLTKTYTTLSAGDYTATVTSADGCTSKSNSIKVVAAKTPEVSITSNGTAVCQGVPVTFTASATSTGNAPLYQWKINGTNTGTASNNPSFETNNLKAGDVVTCEMTSNANICLTSKTVSSNLIKLTAASAGVASVKISSSDTVICKGSNIIFTATSVNGGNSPGYLWAVNGISSTNSGSTFSPASLKDGDVVSCTLTSNANLCPANLTATSNNITVQVIDVPVASVTIAATDTVICTGSTVELTATSINGGPNAAYQWKLNGVNTGSNSALYANNSFANGDVINCVFTSSLRCAVPNSVTSNPIKMSVDKVPVVTIRPDTVILLGSSIKLNTVTTGNIVSYLWSPLTTLDNPIAKDPIATPAATTTYQLRVTTPGNCKAAAHVTITPITEVTITNAFSPNGDGINDLWNIPGLSSYADCSVQIFNRYGQLLFQSKGYTTPWNGTFNGQIVPIGTYYYIISTDKISGKKSGSVTVLR